MNKQKVFRTLLEQGYTKERIRKADLYRADLYRADLSEANLSWANLYRADLYRADLSRADLSGADLSGANLSGANLSGANLSGANLSGANLYRANLSEANLYRANLSEANLSEADLSGANLSAVKTNETTAFYYIFCPESGSFIGFKKASGKIVMLEIQISSKRSSATSLKCRCDRAKVLSIEELDGTISKLKSVPSNYDPKFVYTVGEFVKVDNFDDNRWNECSTGIHFFMSRELAKNYK